EALFGATKTSITRRPARALRARDRLRCSSVSMSCPSAGARERRSDSSGMAREAQEVDMGSPIDREAVPFAVIDTATTGFSPWLKDRVIEVAVVRFDLSGGIRDEFCTLVNPRRDVG